MINRASWSFSAGIAWLLLLTTLLAGCISITKNEGANKPPPSDTSEEIVIKLDRTACFGNCPVYALTIFGNGTVVYVGQDFVQTKGSKETSISTDTVKQLVSEIDKAGYFSLNDSYTKFGVSDMPTVNTSIRMGGKTKTIIHYLGDRTAPKQLTDLENKIDELVNSAQWIK